MYTEYELQTRIRETKEKYKQRYKADYDAKMQLKLQEYDRMVDERVHKIVEDKLRVERLQLQSELQTTQRVRQDLEAKQQDLNRLKQKLQNEATQPSPINDHKLQLDAQSLEQERKKLQQMLLNVEQKVQEVNMDKERLELEKRKFTEDKLKVLSRSHDQLNPEDVRHFYQEQMNSVMSDVFKVVIQECDEVKERKKDIERRERAMEEFINSDEVVRSRLQSLRNTPLRDSVYHTPQSQSSHHLHHHSQYRSSPPSQPRHHGASVPMTFPNMSSSIDVSSMPRPRSTSSPPGSRVGSRIEQTIHNPLLSSQQSSRLSTSGNSIAYAKAVPASVLNSSMNSDWTRNPIHPQLSKDIPPYPEAYSPQQTQYLVRSVLEPVSKEEWIHVQAKV